MSDRPNPNPKRPAAPGGNIRASTPKQRRGQQELIRVTLRPERAARLRRQRLLGWASGALLLAAIVGGGYWSATRGAAWLFFNNPDYNVAVLHVETDGVLTQEAILEAADVREGMNIFKLDLDRAKARIETLPQVQGAAVRRQLPNQVSITVNERKPVAWIAPDSRAKTREEVFVSPQTLLVDTAGVLLKPRKAPAQNFQLPIIRHANVERLSAGQTVDTEEMKAALDLLRAHQESLVGARFQIMEVDLARGYGLMVTDRNGLQVLFGLDDPDLQLRTLDTLLASIASTGRRPATISLMTMETRQRNIPVTFQADPPTPTPPPADSSGVSVSAAEHPPAPPAATAAPAVNPASEKGKTKTPDKIKPPGSGSAHHADSAAKPRGHERAKSKPPARHNEPSVRRALPVIMQPFQPAPGR